MWRGHDLRCFKITNCWNAGMLAIVNRTGTNIPNIPKGLETPAVHKHARQSDRRSNQPIGHSAVQARG